MTIKDIAKEAGYSVGTVSRALNNHPDVSKKAKEKIFEVVKKHDFVLNTNAKHLKQQESKTIVILVKGTSNILLNSILELIQKKIEKTPYNSSVAVLDESDNEAYNGCRIFYERKPVGMIFLGGNPDKYTEDFLKIKAPCVLIMNQASNIENSKLSSISTDDEVAAYKMTCHLIEQGHKNIIVIGGKMSTSETTVRRYHGFSRAMEEAGLPFDFEKSYEEAKYSFSGGYNATGKLLERNPEATAIFTMSDVMAIGACRKITDMGLTIPGDISIVGFDGLPISEYYRPRITTIRQSADILAEDGLEILLNSIENKSLPIHRLVPFSFIIGESVKPL